MNQTLLANIATHVTDLLTNKLDKNYLYHNLRHTQRVVKSTKELVEKCEINDKESERLVIAAWFHDTGYATVGSKDHEKESCAIAKAFLSEHQYPEIDIEAVCKLIMATKSGVEPETTSDKLIIDADNSHFGHDSYIEIAELLRKELLLVDSKEFTIEEWRAENLRLLNNSHRFYTACARELWQEQKDENVRSLIKKEKKAKKRAKKEQLKVQYKNESPERGVQTMFRVALKNHMELSAIADSKANILLSVNAIIISLALSSIFPKLDNPYNRYLVIPTGIFILFSVISMILSVLATRPNVTQGEFTKEDVTNKKVNLLFFGNFHQMKLEHYEWAVGELVKDKDYLYTSLTRDLYYLGLVLHKKYKILRLTYTIFIIGIVISVIAFGIAYNLYGNIRQISDLTSQM
ncbi:Predicted metal-dependent phosphohydrolase, HD superfamily [Pustulibacterium marinum]|uniref:Predicted metal-dependent phosphohydrolase, HD superfamily n=1 Tax=Pustulibacterium marinum TaxID=1224947 RepID=A0A1I7EYP6_9FLAO|nr:Pycsar system effector family protein [Pustulibacterium marinum]SFU29036.1 Predicted metal-dependent phosphohydrolase, HD superfamily [Pustulibacterium marinum]